MDPCRREQKGRVSQGAPLQHREACGSQQASCPARIGWQPSNFCSTRLSLSTVHFQLCWRERQSSRWSAVDAMVVKRSVEGDKVKQKLLDCQPLFFAGQLACGELHAARCCSGAARDIRPFCFRRHGSMGSGGSVQTPPPQTSRLQQLLSLLPHPSRQPPRVGLIPPTHAHPRAHHGAAPPSLHHARRGQHNREINGRIACHKTFVGC